ncbi:MAG: hypothetical protein JSS82_07025 [Bacteroidetes bacterium]|nr:hypothetical protein [Bacteroidota bacterium]
MVGYGILKKFEAILHAYHEKDADGFIKTVNLLNELELHTCAGKYTIDEIIDKKNQDIINRLDRFFEFQNENAEVFSLEYLSMSFIHFLDGYFNSQIELHGQHCIAATEVLADPTIYPASSQGLFNSATPEQILSKEYYFNLLKCRCRWESLTSDLRRELYQACYPGPFELHE